MREFRDDQGRPWQLALTVAAAMRVKDNVTIEVEGKKVPFDLVDVAGLSTTMQVMRSDYTTLAEAIYYVLLPQMEPKGVTKEQFLDGMRGDSLDEAAKCLEQELIDFFPKRLRELVALLVAKMDTTSEAMLAAEKTKLEAMTVEELLAQSGVQSGNVQESSVSTPATGHSASSSSHETAESNVTGGTPPTSSHSNST